MNWPILALAAVMLLAPAAAFYLPCVGACMLLWADRSPQAPRRPPPVRGADELLCDQCYSAGERAPGDPICVYHG
jgi:hypothetical protein